MSSTSATQGRGCVNRGVHLHVDVAVADDDDDDDDDHDQVNDHDHVRAFQTHLDPINAL